MYNVSAYVERCIRSLEEQDIPKEDYEIICINDGSTDDSRNVVLGMLKEFFNIFLIDQENQGVSSARNRGIEKAQGKYILFIDPDDYVEANHFRNLLNNADYRAADVSFLGFTILGGSGEILYRGFEAFKAEHVYDGIEAYRLTRRDGRLDPDRMWGILYKREFLNNHYLRFLSGVPYLEDGELLVRILCYAERCIFDKCAFYQRTFREGSATHSNLFNSEKATYGFLLAVGNLKRFQQEEKLHEKQREFLNQPILKFSMLALNSSFGIGRHKKFKTTVMRLHELNLGKIDLKGCNHREMRFYGRAYNVSPCLGAFVLIIYIKTERLFELLFNRKILQG